jgi:acetyl-CoA acetyltransferase
MSATSPCIVGVGETEYRRWGGIKDRNEFQLACQAIANAASDAGLATRDLDGLACFADTSIDASQLQMALGMETLDLSASVWGGRGGGPCGALALAASAVQSGDANYVAVYRSLCQGQSRRYGKFYGQRLHSELMGPFGLFSAAQCIALIVQRYRHEVGFADEDMAQIALSQRENAQRNPRAVTYGKTLTLAQYLDARKIADPFRLYDCCLETDGACAVIVTTRERARDLNARPVEIVAALQGSEPGWTTGAMGSHNMPDATYASSGQRQLAARLYERADVSPKDIDVAQMYDHFSGMLFTVIEDFGLCEHGAAPTFVREGNTRWPDGRVPINTHGGSLSEAYVHGMNHILEGVRQMRGESTSQVEGAKICLVTGSSGITPSSAAILAA